MKKVTPYMLEKIPDRMAQRFGTIPSGSEDLYLFQLNTFEGNLLKMYRQNPRLRDYDALEAIAGCLLKVDGYLRGVEYDFSSVATEKNKQLCHALLAAFDPRENEELRAVLDETDVTWQGEGQEEYYATPVRCLLRIIKSIELFTKELGATGYFGFIERQFGELINRESGLKLGFCLPLAEEEPEEKMNRGGKVALGLLIIGSLTTLVRLLAQLLIPSGAPQTALEPSSFVQNGTLPLAFICYGIFAYTAIAALYLPLRRRSVSGLKYGALLSAIWIAYLLEPLPHVQPIDRIAYPLADSIALLAMGGLLGRSAGLPLKKAQIVWQWPQIVSVALCFVVGRFFQYTQVGIYSSYGRAPLATMLWTVLTGLVIGWVLRSFATVSSQERILEPGEIFSDWTGDPPVRSALTLGLAFFGANLLLFNFFMPLVFKTDLMDLLWRTLIDVVAVTVGSALGNALKFPASSEKA
jgi:hypothetical protein